MLKALLSDVGATFRKTHELGALMDLLARSGEPLPAKFEDLDSLTPFGALYRYDDYDAGRPLDRRQVRDTLIALRAWAEDRLCARQIEP